MSAYILPSQGKGRQSRTAAGPGCPCLQSLTWMGWRSASILQRSSLIQVPYSRLNPILKGLVIQFSFGYEYQLLGKLAV